MKGKLVIPGVLSVRRSLVISDGLFYAVNAHDEQKAIPVVRHGIRGTQNQVTGADKVSQVQATESAKTFPDSKALRVSFFIRPLSLMDGLSSCSGNGAADFRRAFEDFVSRASDSDGLQEVCRRMARNVFNGRWLWRNRQLGSKIVVRVDMGDEHWEQDALNTPLNRFGDWTKPEMELGDAWMDLLCGGETKTLHVEADIDLGLTGAIEVYPSQNYVDNNSKPKGFARPLYKVDVRKMRRGKDADPTFFEDTVITGFAALRDQKIWNALRTIDTWYTDYTDVGLPIPVEPLGASLSADTFYRPLKNQSLFNLLPTLETLDPNSPSGMFVLACFIRGGVIGEKSDKAEGGEKKGKGSKKSKSEASEEPSNPSAENPSLFDDSNDTPTQD